jgi:hypothetical protein
MGRPGLIQRYASMNRSVRVSSRIVLQSAIELDALRVRAGLSRSAAIEEAIFYWILRERPKADRAHRLRVERVLRDAERWAPIDQLLARASERIPT